MVDWRRGWGSVIVIKLIWCSDLSWIYVSIDWMGVVLPSLLSVHYAICEIDVV